MRIDIWKRRLRSVCMAFSVKKRGRHSWLRAWKMKFQEEIYDTMTPIIRMLVTAGIVALVHYSLFTFAADLSPHKIGAVNFRDGMCSYKQRWRDMVRKLKGAHEIKEAASRLHWCTGSLPRPEKRKGSCGVRSSSVPHGHHTRSHGVWETHPMAFAAPGSQSDLRPFVNDDAGSVSTSQSSVSWRVEDDTLSTDSVKRCGFMRVASNIVRRASSFTLSTKKARSQKGEKQKIRGPHLMHHQSFSQSCLPLGNDLTDSALSHGEQGRKIPFQVKTLPRQSRQSKHIPKVDKAAPLHRSPDSMCQPSLCDRLGPNCSTDKHTSTPSEAEQLAPPDSETEVSLQQPPKEKGAEKQPSILDSRVGLAQGPTVQSNFQETAQQSQKNDDEDYLFMIYDSPTRVVVSPGDEGFEIIRDPHGDEKTSMEVSNICELPLKTVLPSKRHLPNKTILYFTLESLDAMLENASEQETLAIMRALKHMKKCLVESATRLDACEDLLKSSSIWCVLVETDSTDENS